MLGSRFCFRPTVAGLFCRLHIKLKLRSDVMMQLNCHLMLARILDWAFQNNFVAINFLPDLVLEPIHNILRGDRSESLASFAGRKRKSHSQLSDPADQLFGLVEFARLAFCALFFKLSSFRKLAGVTS